jgi:hypothetical protein
MPTADVSRVQFLLTAMKACEKKIFDNLHLRKRLI